MASSGLVGSRAVVRRNYAILPPEGIPDSVLPEWRETAARVLAAPALGAAFAEYLLILAAGGGTRQQLPEGLQAFFFVLEGEIELELNGARHHVAPGGFAYARPGSRFALSAPKPARLLWLKKLYEPCDSRRPADIVGNETRLAGETYLDIEGLILKKLLPDEILFDLAMNIFTFPPGTSLPVTETHFMEHGLYFLQGRGVYYLGDRWHEVQASDFIWMGPYCPQSFYAAGTVPARYIYYKNVHRDVAL
jgi:(S)-ureidoglycine aminohydrolase